MIAAYFIAMYVQMAPDTVEEIYGPADWCQLMAPVEYDGHPGFVESCTPLPIRRPVEGGAS